MATTTGTIPYAAQGANKPCHTFYKQIGTISPSTPTIIAMHGGPGGGHEYLDPVRDLHTAHDLPIIFYDQIGCGQSTHFRERLDDHEFWNIELFVAELENIIAHFKLADENVSAGFYLMGFSWGGMFGSLLASRRPKGLKKLIIVSSPSSIPLYVKGLAQILEGMGEESVRIVKECDEKGEQSSEAYQGVCARFNKTHTCRLDPVPEMMAKAFGNLRDDGTAILTMQGRSRFVFTGAAFKDYEGFKWGHLIEVPTLIANGEYDHVGDLSFEPWFWAIPKVKWVTLHGASHVGQWEAREQLMDLAGKFLMS